MHQVTEGQQQRVHDGHNGSHSCQLYASSQEHADLITPFFVRGLTSQYKCVCTTDSYTKDDLIGLFREKDFDLTPYITSGQFIHFSARDTYAQTGIFDANRTLSIFKDICTCAIQEKYKGIYVSGDVVWSLANEESIGRLLDYESMVNRLTSTMPIVGLCLYDANKISYGTVYNVLRVHPEIRVDDIQIKSPHYIPPDVYECVKDTTVPASEYLPILSDLKAAELQYRSEVKERNTHISELELLNSTMVDRELKMIELKNRIAELEKEQEQNP